MNQRRKFKLFTLSATILICAAALGLVYKFAIAKRQETNRDFIKRMMILEESDEFGWLNKKNLDRNFDLAEPKNYDTPSAPQYTTDSDGHRDSGFYDRHPMVRPVFRVWVIGDSSPFGLGVSTLDVFSEILRYGLYKTNVWVENFAVAGHDTGQIVKLFKYNLKKYADKPDVVVLWGGFNDIEFTKDLFWSSNYEAEVKLPALEANIDELMDLSASMNFKLIINTLPSNIDSKELARVNAFYRSLRAPNLIINDVHAAFLQAGNNIDLYAPLDSALPFYYHPSKKGHALIGVALGRKIRELLEL